MVGAGKKNTKRNLLGSWDKENRPPLIARREEGDGEEWKLQKTGGGDKWGKTACNWAAKTTGYIRQGGRKKGVLWVQKRARSLNGPTLSTRKKAIWLRQAGPFNSANLVQKDFEVTKKGRKILIQPCM